MERSWAHQELSRKKVKKYAATLPGDEISALIESRGAEPVFVGSDVESGQIFWVLNDGVINQYRIMAEINEDMVWEYAVKRHVFEHEYRKFEGMKDLEAYVVYLNRERDTHP